MGQLENMSLLVRIVEAGGIGKAAEQLGLAKSAVSKRLKELESTLSVQLISRTTRVANLTDAGHQYYQQSLGIINAINEMNAQVSGEHQALSGTIRLTVPLTFGLATLNDLFEEFLAQHPKVKLNVEFTDRQVDLLEEGYDLAIRIANLQDSTLKARKISKIEHRLCASPDYLAKHGTPTTVEELKQHTFLEYENKRTVNLHLIEPSGAHAKFAPIIKHKSNNGTFLSRMAIRGEGVICLPTFITKEAIASGYLNVLMHDHSFPDMHLYAVYPHTRFLSHRCRALIDFMAERLGDE